MQRTDGRLLFAATDVVGFHDCEHLTYLDRCAFDDEALRAQKIPADEHGRLIQNKGDEHERRYLARRVRLREKQHRSKL